MKMNSKEDIAIEFGAFIREEREARSLYQFEVAGKLGLSRSYYTQIESGSRDIYFSTAVYICNILDLDLGTFMKRLK